MDSAFQSQEASTTAAVVPNPPSESSDPTMVTPSQVPLPSPLLVTETSTESRENNKNTPTASQKDDLLSMIQILTHLRSKGLDREGIRFPLLVVVTDSSGRHSCKSQLLQSICGSRLWPDCFETEHSNPPVPVTLRRRHCEAGESSFYEIQYNNQKKQLVDTSEFPAQVHTAFKSIIDDQKHEVHHHHQQQQQQHQEEEEGEEEPIFLQLSSYRYLDLGNVFFRWEKGPEDEEETTNIEYLLQGRPIIKPIKWNELETEIDLARGAMHQLNVKSDIVFRTRSPCVHAIPTVYKFSGCPSASDSATTIMYSGQKKEIPQWKNIKREINLARLKLDACRRLNCPVGYPIVLNIREPNPPGPDFIRVDLPQDLVAGALPGGTRSVESVASVIVELLDPEAAEEVILLSVVCADDKNSTAFACALSQLLQNFAVVRTNMEDTKLSLLRQMKQKELAKRRQLVTIPLPGWRGDTRARPSIELTKIKTKVFHDLERYMLCGGITMLSDDENLHYATRTSSILRKYTEQLLREEELFPTTEDMDDFEISDSIPVVASKEQFPDQLVLLNLIKQLDIMQEWSTTLVVELHDYTKLFVLSLLERHLSYFPVLFQRYRDSLTPALREASAISRQFIINTITNEKAISLEIEMRGIPVKTTSQLRMRYKGVELKITSMLKTIFSEAVDTHMKAEVVDSTRYSGTTSLALHSSALKDREELKATINMITDTIKELMFWGQIQCVETSEAITPDTQ